MWSGPNTLLAKVKANTDNAAIRTTLESHNGYISLDDSHHADSFNTGKHLTVHMKAA